MQSTASHDHDRATVNASSQHASRRLAPQAGSMWRKTSRCD